MLDHLDYRLKFGVFVAESHTQHTLLIQTALDLLIILNKSRFMTFIVFGGVLFFCLNRMRLWCHFFQIKPKGAV